MAEEVIVAGAGFAGLNAALELADRGYDVEIIDSKGSHDFVPSVMDIISGMDADDIRLDLADFLSGTSIDFTREKILRINPDEGVVETNSGAHSYENLVVALGYDASAYGMDISDMDTVYSVEGVTEVSERMDDAEDALVLGCSYVGVEAAGELEREGLEVTVVDQVTRPMPNSSREVSEKVLDLFNEKDIAFQGGRKVEEIDSREVIFENGERATADIVVWATGMEASHVIQRSFGCGPHGLEVNSGLNSMDYPDVFAAGACADLEADGTAQNAIDQAEIIAENIAKTDSESLERFEEGDNPFIVTVGKSAILERGGKAYSSRFFKLLKRFIRTRYWIGLSWKKLRLAF